MPEFRASRPSSACHCSIGVGFGALQWLPDSIDGRQRNGEGRAERIGFDLCRKRTKLCIRGELQRVEHKGTDDSRVDTWRTARESHADFGNCDAGRVGVPGNANRISRAGWIEGSVFGVANDTDRRVADKSEAADRELDGPFASRREIAVDRNV
jgi:hypothetical protein